MTERVFVTGTDTGVGKTLVSALLCAALDAVYWKPIQTGTCEGTDREAVMRLAGIPASQTLPEIYAFEPAVSPHLAARRAGKRIDLARIARQPLPMGDALVVEGAGGVLVPLNETQRMTDLMRHLVLPVVLAARSTLGTINHTLLSLAALRQAGVEVVGVVMLGPESRDNREAIEHYGNVRIVGSVPQLAQIDRATLLQVFRERFDPDVFRRSEHAVA